MSPPDLPVVPERSGRGVPSGPKGGRPGQGALYCKEPLRGGGPTAVIAGSCLIALAEHAPEVGCVVEPVEERYFSHGTATLCGVAHGASAFFEATTQDVGSDRLAVGFEKLVQPARR